MLEEHLIDSAAVPLGFSLFTDFIRQDDIADGGAFDWTAVGTGTIATQAANGGWGRISGAATTDDSGGQVQGLAAHVCTSGKVITFKTRAQLNESTSTNATIESDLYAGLFPVDTSIVASLPADGIYFVKADGATAITCVVRVGGTNVYSQAIVPVIDELVHTYGIAIFPNGSNSIVEFSMDGVSVARATGVSLPASTVILTPTIAFQSGDGTGTKFVDVDYLGSYQAR